MALTIPVNLVGIVTSHAQLPTPQSGASDVSTTMQSSKNIPTAPTIAGNNANDVERIRGVATVHASELDRYAPPNPLPTAPILQAAAAYAATRKEI